MPKKQPRQDRSRFTVEAILEAAADILVRDGYAKLTTNRIADRAGVNVASIYQYFPGKEAIVAELRRRHGAAERAAARDALVLRRGQSLEATLRALIARGVAAHAVAPALHRAFAEHMPALRYREIEEADAAVFREMRRFLERSAEGVPDVEFAMWMVATTAHAAIHNGVVERPEDVESGRLVDELVVLLMGYLKRPRARVDQLTRTNRAPP
ncbi:MAG TPA: TetR/AcrR family transcriptional regulator [Gemmatimonadaceae bacterium]